MNVNIVRLVGSLMIAGFFVGTPASPRADGSVYIVNTTDNLVESGIATPCNSRHCSLQEAVLTANVHPGPDRITFQLPGEPPYIIYLGTPEGLTYMEMNIWGDETEIDATTQPGWPVYLHGMGEAGWGMIIHSNQNTVRGMGFLGFNESGLLVLRGSEHNFIDRVVVGNYLGEGLIPAPLENAIGITLHGDNNVVRGASISNNDVGIAIYASNNMIQDSQIGFLSGSSSHRGNVTGINVLGAGNTIERNTFLGNSYYGIRSQYLGNIIQGNWIGVDNSGLHSLGNHYGISLEGLGGNRLGGIDMYDGNIIVANDVGIVIRSPGNQLINNRIGIDFIGAVIPNGIGVQIFSGSEGTILGEGWTGAGNVIANNTAEGILVSDTSQINIVGNTIFGNGGHGIHLQMESGSPPAEGMQVTISRNSIYDNGGRGIYIPVASFNHDVSHPADLRVAGVTASGWTCPGCTVELFEAAPDPYGSGEGKTFLASATAASDGFFTAEIPRLGACSQITATATDELGNTSDFSLNANAVMCVRLPPLVAWIWVIGAGGAGAALLGVLGRRRPPVLAWAAGGVLLGIGLAAGSLYLPFVQVTHPEAHLAQASPVPMLPPCSQFLDPRKLLPADEAVFQAGEDPIFGLSPQPDPPGIQTRWWVTVAGPEDNSGSKDISGEKTFPLSSLGLDPNTTGTYYWKVFAERRTSTSNQWTPVCMDLRTRTFQITQPGQAAPPIAHLNQSANCRSGPGMDYPALDILAQGLSVPVNGRNQQSTWWQVDSPNIQLACWLSGNVIELSGDTGNVPVVQVAPPPVPVPSDTPVPPVNCGQYNSNTCNQNSACTWNNGACVNK